MHSRAPVVLFDLNGTLTDVSAIGDPWGDRDLGRHVLADAVKGAMVCTILGEHSAFAFHIESALRVLVAQRSLDPARVEAALERAAGLPAFVDADAALSTLAAAGHRLAVLTNSGAQSGRDTLETAGIAHHFDRILGVDAVKQFKPHPDTYAHALTELARPPSEIVFVAAHTWDLAGAKHAGFTTVWIARSDQTWPSVFAEPDIVVDDLRAAAAAIGSHHNGLTSEFDV